MVDHPHPHRILSSPPSQLTQTGVPRSHAARTAAAGREVRSSTARRPAERAGFTWPVHEGATAKVRFLMARAKAPHQLWPPVWASPAARYSGTPQARSSQEALQAGLEEETARDWQPGVRAGIRKQAAMYAAFTVVS